MAYKATKVDGTSNNKFSITVEDGIQHPQGETMVRITFLPILYGKWETK
jgi:hypothetical protein